MGSRAGEWLTPSLWHLPHPRQEADGQSHGLPPRHFTDTSTIVDNLGRKKKNWKREGGPESNAISGKMQRKEETVKHGVRKQRDLWEDIEMVSENGKMRQMQGAERSGQIQSQTDRQGNGAGWRQRNPSPGCTD